MCVMMIQQAAAFMDPVQQEMFVVGLDFAKTQLSPFVAGIV